MSDTVISTKNAPAAIGPYSQAIRHGDLLFCSGQIPIVPDTGEVLTGDIKDQARQSCKNVMALLAAAGLSAKNVIKTTVFITDMNEFPQVNEVYAEYFTEPFPARSCVAVASLPKDVRIEVEVIAHF